MANATVIAKKMRCTIVHTGGGEYLEDEDEHSKGEKRGQKRLNPRDAKGVEVPKQKYGHSVPDTQYMAMETRRRLFINSYTPDASGGPNSWQRFSGSRLRHNAAPGDIVLLVPKLGSNRVLDPGKFQNVVTPLLMEICTQYVPVNGEPPVRYLVVPELRGP